MATPLILKRAPIGDNQDDYDVLENGAACPMPSLLERLGVRLPGLPQGRLTVGPLRCPLCRPYRGAA
jgi:hypothetical protein